MATKRQLHESDAQEPVHASRQFQVYGANQRPTKKPRKSEPAMRRKQAHASSVNSIKKRIRDVRRRLERAEDLPANVRAEDERALAAYEQELAAADAEKTRQKIIQKYHMVRFFERQKATRQLKKLRKRLLEAQSPEEIETLKSQMHVAQVDHDYTQYYPLGEVYVSLFPQKSAAIGQEVTGVGSKPPMWKEVEKCMEEGTLSRLRNRAPNVSISAPRNLERRSAKMKPRVAAVESSGLNRRQRRTQQGVTATRRSRHKSVEAGYVMKDKAADIDSGESEGGFFEE